MTVYIDVLLLENIAINFVILAVTSHFSRAKAGVGRLLLGALVGAVYVVVAFCPGFETFFTLIAKILLSLVIVSVTFWPEKIYGFIRITMIFYLVSFVFGGAAFGLFYFLNVEGSIYNGIYYITNFPLKTLIISSVFAYIVIRVSWDFVKGRITNENIMVPLSIRFNEEAVSMTALIDTGNSLKDPITNLPVIVVEFDVIKELMPQEISQIFFESAENDLEVLSKAVLNTSWAKRFRLIPFTSLGTENGMLTGFKPDEVEVGGNIQKKSYQDVIVGVYNKKLSNDQGYKALLGLELAE